MAMECWVNQFQAHKDGSLPYNEIKQMYELRLSQATTKWAFTIFLVGIYYSEVF